MTLTTAAVWTAIFAAWVYFERRREKQGKPTSLPYALLPVVLMVAGGLAILYLLVLFVRFAWAG